MASRKRALSRWLVGKPPEGEARWSLRLLADKMVELEIVEDISYQTVGRTLKKHPEATPEEAVLHPAQG